MQPLLPMRESVLHRWLVRNLQITDDNACLSSQVKYPIHNPPATPPGIDGSMKCSHESYCTFAYSNGALTGLIFRRFCRNLADAHYILVLRT
jgi:hypothetical protein